MFAFTSSRPNRFLTSAWPNSCNSSAAHYHRAAFRVNWLFICVSACCHTLFTPLTEKPFMFQNWFHMLPLLLAWQYWRALTLSTGRWKTGVASDAGRKYLYILSFCLCVNYSVSEWGITNGMWVMGCSILRRRETGVKGIRWDPMGVEGEGCICVCMCWLRVGSEPWLLSEFSS